MVKTTDMKIPTKIDKKTRMFEDLIFQYYADNQSEIDPKKDSYDKIKYMYVKIRKLLIRENPKVISKLIIKDLFDLCTTMLMVSLQSKRSTMCDITILTKKEKDSVIKKYDPEFGFVQPDYIQVRDKLTGNVMLIEQL